MTHVRSCSLCCSRWAFCRLATLSLVRWSHRMLSLAFAPSPARLQNDTEGYQQRTHRTDHHLDHHIDHLRSCRSSRVRVIGLDYLDPISVMVHHVLRDMVTNTDPTQETRAIARSFRPSRSCHPATASSSHADHTDQGCICPPRKYTHHKSRHCCPTCNNVKKQPLTADTKYQHAAKKQPEINSTRAIMLFRHTATRWKASPLGASPLVVCEFQGEQIPGLHDLHGLYTMLPSDRRSYGLDDLLIARVS